MRILLTAHRFFPHVGGTEEVVGHLARGLAKRGHEVTVATSRERASAHYEEREGYRIVRYDLRTHGKYRFPPSAYRELVLEGPWDVVHLHGQRIWSTDHLYRHFRKARSPLVFTAHGFYQWHMERVPLVDPLYYRVVLPRALRRVSAVTALTSGERDELVSWGVSPERIHVLGNGIPVEEFSTPPAGFRARAGFGSDERVLLYVGGYYPNKRVDRLVEAAGLLGGGVTLVVVGKDQDPRRGEPYCRALAKRTGARVHFAGPLPRREVLSAYAECDAFVLASAFEGFGLVLLEAMAAGLPFVSTRAGAAPDLAALGAGLLAPDDPAGFAAQVRPLLDDADLRRKLGAAGKAAAPSFSWPAVVERYERVYEGVARR